MYWPLMRPLWDSPKRWQAVGLLLLGVVASVIEQRGCWCGKALQRGEFISALAARGLERFQQATGRAGGGAGGVVRCCYRSALSARSPGSDLATLADPSFSGSAYLEGSGITGLDTQTAVDTRTKRIGVRNSENVELQGGGQVLAVAMLGPGAGVRWYS